MFGEKSFSKHIDYLRNKKYLYKQIYSTEFTFELDDGDDYEKFIQNQPRWYKKLGDSVAVDEPLVELETDKVTLEVPSPCGGQLKIISAEEGETVEVGALLGQIAEEDADNTVSEKVIESENKTQEIQTAEIQVDKL